MSWKDVTWWQYLIAALVFLLFGSKKVVGRVLGISMDDNKDGIVSYSEWVRLPFFYLIAFVTVMKAIGYSDSFGTTEYIGLLCWAGGVQVFIHFLDNWKVPSIGSNINQSGSVEPDDYIPPPEQ